MREETGSKRYELGCVVSSDVISKLTVKDKQMMSEVLSSIIFKSAVDGYYLSPIQSSAVVPPLSVDLDLTPEGTIFKVILFGSNKKRLAPGGMEYHCKDCDVWIEARDYFLHFENHGKEKGGKT